MSLQPGWTAKPGFVSSNLQHTYVARWNHQNWKWRSTGGVLHVDAFFCNAGALSWWGMPLTP
jgi:hypothetical protein